MKRFIRVALLLFVFYCLNIGFLFRRFLDHDDGLHPSSSDGHVPSALRPLATTKRERNESRAVRDTTQTEGNGQETMTGKKDVAAQVATSSRIFEDDRWEPLIPGNQSWESPYNRRAPRLDIVWCRGWYNSFLPHKETSIDYYNSKGLHDWKSSPADLSRWFVPTQCGPIWIRSNDLNWWADSILPFVNCSFMLITSNSIYGPSQASERKILNSPHLDVWYRQNMLDPTLSDKVLPIPLGLPIHYGFKGSPDAVHTVQTLTSIRRSMTPFADRTERTILVDVGTMTGGGERAVARMEMHKALKDCRNVKIMPKTTRMDAWTNQYSTHHFATVARGTGWDTYRPWEYLFFETVPIYKSPSPMDHLHLPAHTPIVLVKEWSEICAWTDEYYDILVDRYKGWIRNSHHWLKPSLWVPRNQTRMEELCDMSPGCRETEAERRHVSLVAASDLKQQKS